MGDIPLPADSLTGARVVVAGVWVRCMNEGDQGGFQL